MPEVRPVKRLVLVVFFFEVGVVLIFIPWSAFWDWNYFAQLVPPLQAAITNNFFRGAVSGLGVVNVVAGLESCRLSSRPRIGRLR